MKNFTLLGLFFTTAFFAQTYSTGPMQFDTNYGAQIDVNSTSNVVTLTLTGPSDRYLGIGFDTVNMLTAGKDCLIFNGTSLTDRSFNGNTGTPALDGVQDWTIASNNVNFGVRTLVATRARVATAANDFTFPAAAGPLQLVWSRGDNNGFNLQYHGGAGRSAFSSNLTLGNNQFEKQSFQMFPNPAKGFVTIAMPSDLTTKGELKMYDISGRVVKVQTISELETQINTSELQTGNYLVVVRTEFGNSTKQLAIE